MESLLRTHHWHSHRQECEPAAVAGQVSFSPIQGRSVAAIIIRLLLWKDAQLLLCRAPQSLYDEIDGNAWPSINRERCVMAFLRMLRIVLWSFFGVRKSASHQADMAAIKLPLLPLVAVGLAAGFGGILLCLARIATTVAH
jgi:Protein of unknown function (DUF2970)